MTRIILLNTIKPMLGRLAQNTFESPDHFFELKWDGMRAVAFFEGDAVKIFSRNGRDIISNLPELAELPSNIRPAPMIIGGDMVCLDEHNKPSFSRLQQY
jgi:bifunctional non-homologous end joining protein LigD